MKMPDGYRAVNTGERIITGDIFHDVDTGDGIEVKPHYFTVGEPYDGSGFLIRAVKRPAPAKKQPKAKAVKANLAYAKYTDHGALVAVSLNPHNKFCKTRVRIIDISNPDALALQAAAAIDALPRRSTKGDCARAVLESLGIIPKRKAK